MVDYGTHLDCERDVGIENGALGISQGRNGATSAIRDIEPGDGNVRDGSFRKLRLEHDIEDEYSESGEDDEDDEEGEEDGEAVAERRR